MDRDAEQSGTKDKGEDEGNNCPSPTRLTVEESSFNGCIRRTARGNTICNRNDWVGSPQRSSNHQLYQQSYSNDSFTSKRQNLLNETFTSEGLDMAAASHTNSSTDASSRRKRLLLSNIDAYEHDMLHRCGMSAGGQREDHSKFSRDLSAKEVECGLANQCSGKIHTHSFSDINSEDSVLDDALTDEDDVDAGCVMEDVATLDEESKAEVVLSLESRDGVGAQSFDKSSILPDEFCSFGSKSPDDIVRTIMRFFDKFCDCLRMRDIAPDEFKTLLATISKACQARRCAGDKIKILIKVKDSHFAKTVIPSILSDSRTRTTSSDIHTTVMNILILIRCIATHFPSSIAVVFGLNDALQRRISALESEGILDTDIVKEMETLSQIKGTMMKRLEKEKQKACAPKTKLKPPDDFRLLSVFPHTEDINLHYVPFLRKNKKIGGYEDVDDYLDTQFRLLREDFIQPLRDGIDEFWAYQKNPRMRTTIRVYTDVSIVSRVLSNEKILHTIKFDVKVFKNVTWENSKRLIYGTLLCLSSDNFQTLSLATVAQSERELLTYGLLNVEFQLECNEVENLKKKTFIMIETPAYFEAYKHVLEAMQTIHDDLPFAQYIVHCETDCKPPLYLRDRYLDFRRTMGMKEKVEKSSMGIKKVTKQAFISKKALAYNRNISNEKQDGAVIVTDEFTHQWPEADALKLNDAQYKAFKDALSKEFCIIQGPPGTGKTYLGLKIVETLLLNYSLWHQSVHGKTRSNHPILLVCNTNHALDQFIEGVSKCFKTDATDCIVRLGGRGQNETVEKFNIKKRRRDLNANADASASRGQRTQVCRQQEIMYNRIHINGWQIDALKEGIIHEDVLKPFMGHHFYVLTGMFQMRESNPAILNWLDFKMLTRKSINREYIQHVDYAVDDYFADNVDLLEKKENMMALSLKEIWTTYDENKQNHLGIKEYGLSQLSEEQRRKMYNTIRQNLMTNAKMNKGENDRIKNIWKLSKNNKWQLYRHWIYQLRAYLMKKKAKDLKQDIAKFQEKAKEYEALSRDIDYHIVKKAMVIAMTTTGAAKNRELLKKVRPRIVVIEEAAEVLESHTVTSLHPGCEHLILIGDHLQLRPNPKVYTLAKRYNLDISLFERMANNGHKTNTLTLQHRMRPSISRLMRHIYLKLDDHPSVGMYDNIKGVGKNLFFINHSEKERNSEDSLSHANDFEAAYLVKLCNYLLLQGYSQSQITILSTYAAQVSSIRKLLPKPEYTEVVVTAVDNFQGEENDIILLSLVRSNDEEKVGFLKIENRVCVALSRAKMGLYVIGNFDILEKQSDMWRKIIKDVKENNEFGLGLPLYCQNHTKDDGIVAIKVEDFERAPDGGCIKKCDFRLECGHVCRLSCHPVDGEHKYYKCRQPCLKKCPKGHNCKDLCFEDCSKCTIVISKLLPVCNHIQNGLCYIDAEDEECEHPCEMKCPKGHMCEKQCHEDCGDCMITVEKTLPECGHSQDGFCYIDPEDEECEHPCEKKCPKGHLCEKQCHENCGDCMVTVEKTLPECGHSQDGFCYVKPENESCKNPCKKTCTEGHKCKKQCSDACGICIILVNKVVPKCGHSMRVYCCVPSNDIKCLHQCERRCPRGHPCYKKCHEKCDPCSVEVEIILPKCGHAQHVLCSQDPAKVKCETECDNLLSCDHICGNLCGDEICQCKAFLLMTLKCGHTGRVLCEQRHDENPVCTVKCKATLKCGHLCEGSCTGCSMGRLHKKCPQQHTCLLLCGHEGTIQGTYAESCSKNCPSHCSHTSCSYPCGTPCIRCTRRSCSWKCQHYKCNRECKDYCSRPPCSRSCNRMLLCRHKCVGICGERCPVECKVCTPDEFPTSFMGRPVETHALYVSLLNCDHILEMSFLDLWMSNQKNKHGVLVVGHRLCPFCLTPIRNCPRYGNVIKEIEYDLEIIYKRNSIRLERIAEIKHNIQLRKKRLDDNVRNKVIALGSMLSLLIEESKVLVLEETQTIKAELNSLNSHSQETDEIQQVVNDSSNLQTWILGRKDYISEQEKDDSENELKRLKLLLVLLKSKYGVINCRKEPNEEHRVEIMRKLELQRARKERYQRMFTRSGSEVYSHLSRGTQIDIDHLQYTLDSMSDDKSEKEEEVTFGQVNDAQKEAVNCFIKLLQRPGIPAPRIYTRTAELLGKFPQHQDANIASVTDVTVVLKPFVHGCWFKCVKEGHIFYEGSPCRKPNPEEVQCPECNQSNQP